MMDEKALMHALGEQIRHHRTKRGKTQNWLAEQADLSTRFLCLLETGQKCARLITLLRISEALDITLSELLTGIERN